MTLGISLFLWSTGLPSLFLQVEAASLTNASDTLSNSAPGVGSNHTISFTTDNGLLISETITLEFDEPGDAFNLTGVTEDDVDININGLASTTAAAASASDWGVDINTGTDVITLTAPSGQGGVASSSVIEILIGSHAVDSGTGANQITNPSATSSYLIEIAGSMQDTGQVRVAIIDEVTVSASVDASLSFSVSGVGTGQAVNGTTTDLTSTNITLPFGTIPTNVTRTLAHDLAVTTNAASGFTVTVETTGDLQSTTGATINTFSIGTDVATPTTWSSPTGAIANADSYGHWGVTSDDATIPARSGDDFLSNEFIAATTTPSAIMGHNGVADGSTSGQGATRVGYQIEISDLQEAGDDYSTTLRYIATPSF
jgi:hypothetical protein